MSRTLVLLAVGVVGGGVLGLAVGGGVGLLAGVAYARQQLATPAQERYSVSSRRDASPDELPELLGLVIVTTPDEMSREYAKNKVAADLKFKGKRVRVRDFAVVGGSAEQAYILMDGLGSDGYWLHLKFKVSAAEAAAFGNRREVTVEGVLVERRDHATTQVAYEGDLYFTDCKIVAK